MNGETNLNLLEDVVKKYDDENNFFRNQKLAKMMDIFLLAFVIFLICVLSATP
jgi:hypothetical protein